MKRTKYGNKKTKVKTNDKDLTFDSKLEADYYKYLLKQQEKGLITSIELQPSIQLIPSFKTSYGKTFRKASYIADFKITYPDGTTEYLDTKGRETDIFKLKRKLLEFQNPDLTFYLVKRTTPTTFKKYR